MSGAKVMTSCPSWLNRRFWPVPSPLCCFWSQPKCQMNTKNITVFPFDTVFRKLYKLWTNRIIESVLFLPGMVSTSPPYPVSEGWRNHFRWPSSLEPWKRLASGEPEVLRQNLTWEPRPSTRIWRYWTRLRKPSWEWRFSRVRTPKKTIKTRNSFHFEKKMDCYDNTTVLLWSHNQGKLMRKTTLLNLHNKTIP